MNAEASDEELVAAFRRGERSALERHLSAVWTFAFQLVLDRNSADDLAQEAWLRVIRGLPTFRGGAAFRTWLFRIVINASRDRFGSDLRQGTEPANADFDPPARRCDRPDHLAVQGELESEMTKALGALPEHLRAALALTTLQGLTPAEAASVEGCTTNTIYWRIHEARKLLREQLAPWIT